MANAYLENALRSIDGAISLPENEIKRIGKILAKIIDLLISEMKKDSLFDELYERIYYGGSFYDGLRVRGVNRFDLDILMRIPSRASPALDETAVSGFVNCRMRNRNAEINRTFLQMLDDDGFIKTTAVCQWMESATSKALDAICCCGELKIFPHKFKVTTCKRGAATTIHLQGNNLTMDLDLTPCFAFKENVWPEGHRSNPIPGKEFFIVPQATKEVWRPSFPEQERQLMDGKPFLKPALKLLKRLRDHQGHEAIASYHLKTVFLWEAERNAKVFNKSLAQAFLAMLDKYIQWLEKKEIPYFWNESENLLVGVGSATLESYAERLRYIRTNLGNYTVNTYMGV